MNFTSSLNTWSNSFISSGVLFGLEASFFQDSGATSNGSALGFVIPLWTTISLKNTAIASPISAFALDNSCKIEVLCGT